jgi:NIMA-interacting peptidyl-prolyl cis-trans isomerase 1
MFTVRVFRGGIEATAAEDRTCLFFFCPSSKMPSGLPFGWKLKESKSRPGVVYYITPAGASQWTEPSEKQIQAAKLASKKHQSNKRSRTESSSSNDHNKRAKTAKVRASHILVKHVNSRNPSSWRQEGKIIRTESQANERILEIRNQLITKIGENNDSSDNTTFEARLAEFANAAKVDSDCSSYKRGGDLDYFAFDKMDPAFSAVSFGLKYGEISEPFKSASGIHIVLRTDDNGASSSSSSNSSSSEVKEVQVLHILKKHTGSRRPMREGQPITRTKKEAINAINELLEGLKQIESGSDSKEELESMFREFATNESDCSSRREGGDLKLFGRDKMQPSFEKASFGLAVGGLTNNYIETASGVHIILRIR